MTKRKEDWKPVTISMAIRLWKQCQAKAKRDDMEWRQWVFNALLAALEAK